MKSIIYRSGDRGHADHGWLNAWHTFSFSDYYNADRINFGALRVLNDDTIAGGEGFPTHPHDNMEIITIPLSGSLEHRDSMGNHGIISKGEVQVMSAGTGIRHSEFNHSSDMEVRLFQLWVFPKTRGVTPRYDQFDVSDIRVTNSLYQIIGPQPVTTGSWIHQDAWFYMADYTRRTNTGYSLKRDGNGIFLMVVEGKVVVGENLLERRDAVGISESEEIIIEAEEGTSILLIDLPLTY